MGDPWGQANRRQVTPQQIALGEPCHSIRFQQIPFLISEPLVTERSLSVSGSPNSFSKDKEQLAYRSKDGGERREEKE
uniref:Uncharacterized protein n=1 Tax=Caenorhabditis tropicalis TaxID=1561998 RepID=A0A1I7TZF4_9PELO